MKNKLREKTNHTPNEQAETEKKRAIELHAYHLWLADGAGHGNALQYWLRAEGELESRHPAHPQ
jgi:hypothetical protein